MEKKVLGVKKLFFVLFIFLLFFIYQLLYSKTINIEFGSLLIFVTFIYGFFMNSIFSFTQKKFEFFRKSVAVISANIQSLANLGKLSKQKSFEKKFNKSLKEFVESLIKIKPQQYCKTQKYIDNIYQSLNSFNINNKNNKQIYGSIISCLDSMTRFREEAELTGYRYLVGELKALFYLYPLFISVLLILASWNNLLLLGFSFVLIFILIFTMVLLVDVDSLDYGSYNVRTSNLKILIDDYFSDDKTKEK
jgi:hypothetical protein